MTYVIDKEGRPLMPTDRGGKVKRLLDTKQARVVRRSPFTIQLLYDTPGITQEITLGVDAGSKTVGLSATTAKKEIYAVEAQLRTDVVEKLSTRREARHARRNRKTRYRKPRFSNRKRSEGWLAPSVEQRIRSHETLIRHAHEILPITKIIVEVASFDTQMLKNPDIQGIEYQQGEMYGWNSREYVLYRDGHTCQYCKGKSKDRILETHHIESRKTGGDAPNNLVTVCKTCHDAHNRGELAFKFKRGRSYRNEAYMNVMRWALYDRLKAVYADVGLTYGYITKNVRISSDLEKTHAVDARCISGNPLARSCHERYEMRFVRRHNRQLHKFKTSKGGVRKPNQCPRLVHGFALYDKVRYNGMECFVSGRRKSGSFSLCNIDGRQITGGVSYKKLVFIEHSGTLLISRRAA